MTALIIHATKQLPPGLLATLKRANIELHPIAIDSNRPRSGVPAEPDDFSHLHNLTAEQEEQAFREAARANQQRFWNRNSHLL